MSATHEVCRDVGMKGGRSDAKVLFGGPKEQCSEYLSFDRKKRSKIFSRRIAYIRTKRSHRQ